VNEGNLEMATITLGVQTSREDNRTEEHVLALRKLLREMCPGPYSADVDEFALVLRVGGEMQEFDVEGCDRIRRSRKERYITVDLGFPSQRWKGATDQTIREYLVEAVETGLLCCIRRLETDKSPVESTKLMDCFAKVKNRFLSGEQSAR
jgi:hypothetical protein